MLGAIGSHMFDSLLWWTNLDVNEVYGQLPIHVPSVKSNGETEIRTAEDSFQVVGTFETGASFSVELTSASLHKANQWRLEIFGTEGTLVMTDDAHVQVGVGQEELTNVELAPTIPEPLDLSSRALAYYQAFYPMLSNVYQSITDNQPTQHVPTFENGHRVQLILDAIRLSAKEGKKVTVSK
jgi:predicted dehydrogenase